MKILCYGEILFDWISGKKHLGGAPLNLSVHLSRLEAEVYLVSAVGDDDPGQEALKKIIELNIKSDFINIDKSHRTGMVNVELDYKGVPVFNIINDTAYDHIRLDADQWGRIEGIPFDCVCFGTLAQRQAVSQQTLNDLLGRVNTKHVFCDLNLRDNNYSKEVILRSLEQSTILKTNESEADYLGELFYGKNPDNKTLADHLRKNHRIEILIITRGGDGCLAYSESREIAVPGIKAKIVDTVGAGDAFSAGFLSEYLKDHDLEKACAAGNRLGAEIAGQAGAI